MDQDTLKRFTVSMLLCMALLLTWQYFNPQEPATPAVPQSQLAPANISPAVPVAGQWKLKAVDTQGEIILGTLDPDDGYEAKIIFDAATGSVSQVLLNQFKFKIDDEQVGYPLLNSVKDAQGNIIHSFMLEQLNITGLNYPLMLNGSYWQASDVLTGNDGTQTVSFTATVQNAEDADMLQIVKSFTYRQDDHELDFAIDMVNLSDNAVGVENIKMYGPVGILREDFRADGRSIAIGMIDSKNKFDTARALMNDLGNFGQEILMLEQGQNFRWYSAGNKYFAAGLRPKTYQNNNVFMSNDQINAFGFRLQNRPEKLAGSDETLGFSTVLEPGAIIAAGQRNRLEFAVYVGPVGRQFFKDPRFAGLHYEQMTKTETCACCTFEFLNVAVIGMLDGINKVVHNYGIAIIIMVLFVRLILHPISKKSQVNMMSMSKLGPKVEEIKKKYAGDQQEIQKQTMLLYREQGFTPILGCLPMLLQMPIWIALFTTVSTHIPLRHSGMFPAGFGWLNDLSAPDRLIPFSAVGIPSFTMPLMGEIDALNLLPILLCLAMFLQMKYSPQSSVQAQANPQVAQQQKMMMVMMPIMMLLFFYNGSSGLNLYIMASTFAGLIEQHFIRKHIQEKEALEAASGPSKNVIVIDGKAATKIGPKKKKPKPPFKMQ